MQLLPVIDLTSLNDDDTASRISALSLRCKQHGCAAVCCFNEFVPTALKEQVRVATVCNFPHGEDEIEVVEKQIKNAIEAGAHEVDVVFPYKQFLIDPIKNQELAKLFVGRVVSVVSPRTETSNHVIVKIILETGMFPTLDSLFLAASIVASKLRDGDFLKTSTGKRGQGATIDAVKILWQVIQHVRPNKMIGLKISGGIRTVQDAQRFLTTLNIENPSPTWFRFGASALLDDIVGHDGSNKNAKY